MLGASLIGYLFGRAIVGVIQLAIWIVEGSAYLIGAAGGLVASTIQSARQGSLGRGRRN